MSEPHTFSMEKTATEISQWVAQLSSASPKQQLQLISQLASEGEAGLTALMDFLKTISRNSVDLPIGKAYQILYQAKTPATDNFVQTHFPDGIVPLLSERNIDYCLLQELLREQDFQTADSLTRQKLCELAGEAALQRKWLYFTEVEQFPATDLDTLNRLWWIYSEGKFGFSVQRHIWLSLGQDFTKLWHKIGWKKGNSWTQYPNEFIWDLSAPEGHLPLLNQLRGVRVTASLYNHPVWSDRSE